MQFGSIKTSRFLIAFLYKMYYPAIILGLPEICHGLVKVFLERNTKTISFFSKNCK
jgi:hypothetical protein